MRFSRISFNGEGTAIKYYYFVNNFLIFDTQYLRLTPILLFRVHAGSRTIELNNMNEK